ncbi:MAG: aldo/keto reductase [Desulfobacterales bacterium]|nr:MAG: aldo/keto reductase [Desulfobacterales bacterium]
MNFDQPRFLGQTDLKVGRLGIGAGYGAPAVALEEAFARGCNYFYWSSRKPEMGRAIKNICRQGKRDQLVVVVQSYSRSAFLLEVTFKKALKSLLVDYVDVLILGWYNKSPAARIIERALDLKEKGFCRYLGLSGHNRSLFPKLARDGIMDLFHIRYNAAHRGAERETFPYLEKENRPGIVSYTATRWGHLLNPKKMPTGLPLPSATDCYRFVLSHPAVDVCLCGPKNTEQMRVALKALELGPLTQTEMEHMRTIGDYVREKTAKFF